MKEQVFKLFNILYKKYYFLYKPIYFFYKKISDKSKISFLKKRVHTGMQVLDIGANIGFYTILLSKLVGENGKVYAFEPDETNFKHLKANTQHLKNVVINQLAVGEKTETLKLYYSDELNVDHQTFDSGENRPFVEINATSIDNYFEKKIPIDFVKLDIQGYDYYAVKGMVQTIEKSPKITIFGEFWPYALRKAGVNYQQYLDLLQQTNFKVKVFDEEPNNNYDHKVKDKNYYTDFLATKA